MQATNETPLVYLNLIHDLPRVLSSTYEGGGA